MLEGRGLDTDSDARLNQLSEVQHGAKLFSWQVGLEKSQEDQMVSKLGESFTQSNKSGSKFRSG